MGPKIDVVLGTRPTTTVDVLSWNRGENEQDKKSSQTWKATGPSDRPSTNAWT